MNSTLDENIFDLCIRVLNYAIEFARTGGYAALRFMDVLNSLLDIAVEMDGTPRKEIYRRAKKEIEKSNLLADTEERARFLDGMLDMFLEEWRKTV